MATTEHLFAELVGQAKRGDVAAKDLVFTLIRRRLRAIAAVRLRGWREEDQEDIVQDTMRILTERWAELDGDIALFALQVLRFRIGTAYQKHGKHKHIPFGMESGNESEANTNQAPESAGAINPVDEQDEAIEKKRRIELVLKALRRLPLHCQTIVTGLLEGFSVAEIWKEMSALEPRLKRSAFDKRKSDCIGKLSILIGEAAP